MRASSLTCGLVAVAVIAVIVSQHLQCAHHPMAIFHQVCMSSLWYCVNTGGVTVATLGRGVWL
jgi:hypothetical protein